MVTPRAPVQSLLRATEEATEAAPEAKPAAEKPKPKPKPKAAAKKEGPTGIFSPLVRVAKAIVGEERLNNWRGKAIGAHSGVIDSLVQTSDTRFGRVALKTIFEWIDTDQSGAIDKEELFVALRGAGFTFVDEKKASDILKKADADGNEVIDFDEFIEKAPQVLRQNLLKLAKSNGKAMGLMT